MDVVLKNAIAKAKDQAKLNQKNLRLLDMTVDHEPEESRIVLRVTSEIGIDFKFDPIEMIVGLVADKLDKTSKKS